MRELKCRQWIYQMGLGGCSQADHVLVTLPQCCGTAGSKEGRSKSLWQDWQPQINLGGACCWHTGTGTLCVPIARRGCPLCAALSGRAMVRGSLFQGFSFSKHKRTCLKFIPSCWSWESSITLKFGSLLSVPRLLCACTEPLTEPCRTPRWHVPRGWRCPGQQPLCGEHHGQSRHSPSPTAASQRVAASQLRHWPW